MNGDMDNLISKCSSVLIIRCAPWSQCQALFENIHRHIGVSTKISWLVQESCEPEFKKRFGTLVKSVCVKTEKFEMKSLSQLLTAPEFLNRKFECIMIPFNNQRSRGYYDLVKFVVAIGIPSYAFYPNSHWKKISFSWYVGIRIFERIWNLVEPVLFWHLFALNIPRILFGFMNTKNRKFRRKYGVSPFKRLRPDLEPGQFIYPLY